MKIDKPYKVKDDYINKGPIITNEKKVYVPLSIIPSKVMIIENLKITISNDLKDIFNFNVDTTFGRLSNGIIPNVCITSKEDIEFNENTKLEYLKSIIRRCGILEEYKEFFTNDPDIIINSYTLDIHKEYQFFDEFKQGLMIAEEIFE